MAKITFKEVHTFKLEEALRFLRNADGRVRFQFRVSAFMPIETDGPEGPDVGKGFEGVTYITVSKKQALLLAAGLLSPTLEKRGARLRIETDPPTHVGSLSFITVS